MITQQSVKAIKSQMDIVDIVSNYIELKKSGANFKACCPFHDEKTPSLMVSPSKQIFHCFGCQKGGDAIQFVMEYEKLNYPEALEKIADTIGITVEHEAGSENKHDYKRVMESVSVFYEQNLNDEHREYLYGRGLTEETIRAWGIGYAPRNPKTQQFLEANFLPLPVAQELGVMAKSEGRIYARFSERIMFPIKSHTGHIVGFAGRTLKTDTKVAKYINSPDTKLFDKSSILFGFDQAKEYIYAKRYAIVHEGQLDVILAHQHGIKTTIATQGTALTEKHLPMLKKTGAKVILAYDGDNAGKEAALKGAILLSTHGFDGGIVLFPIGEDPASMLASGRAEEYKKLLKSSTPLVEFVLTAITRKYNLSNPHDKNNALVECVTHLKQLNPVVANEYLLYVSELVKVPVSLIHIGEIKKQQQSPMIHAKSTMEESLLMTMYRNPSLIDECVSICSEQAWQNQELYWKIIQHKVLQNDMTELILKDGVLELQPESFIATVKAKQKSYLLALRERATEFSEIIRINNQLKEVS